jgi:hypothetical protein
MSGERRLDQGSGGVDEAMTGHNQFVGFGFDNKRSASTYSPFFPLVAAFAKFCFTLSLTILSIKP